MPELPEVEHLRRTLQPALIGATIDKVALRRKDIVRQPDTTSRRRICSTDLLEGATICRLDRLGKNLALVSRDGRTLGVHLGMTGQLLFVPDGRHLEKTDHVHCIWKIQTRRTHGKLVFRDPRRFGGLTPYANVERMTLEWQSRLGPDALEIKSQALTAALSRSRRVIKAALLDQAVLAGVGNIYADESLFRAGIHPLANTARLSSDQTRKLAHAIRTVLKNAIDAGGSTIGSYVDSNGSAGRYGQSHKVYGREGLPCERCGRPLLHITVAQRTTTFCGSCQVRR